MIKITIETDDKEPIVLESDMYILSVANRDGNLLRARNGWGGATYPELTRMIIGISADIHKQLNDEVTKEHLPQPCNDCCSCPSEVK